MVKSENKTVKWVTTTEEEIIEKMVRSDHPFRQLSQIINFAEIISPYYILYSDLGKEGIDIIKGFKALMIQFWEDYSDREMERLLKENVAVKWHCRQTPIS